MVDFLKNNMSVMGDIALFAMAGCIIGGFMYAEQWQTAEALSSTLFGAMIMRFRRR